MPRRKLSFQTWRREVVKFEWNEIIWRGHRRGLMSKRPLHLWCNHKSCQSDVWRNDRHMKSPQSIMWSWTRLIFNGLLVTDGGPENWCWERRAVREVFQQVDILKTRHYVDIMRISQFRTVNAKQRSSNKWLNYFHIATVLRRQSDPFWNRWFCASPFSLNAMHFHHVLFRGGFLLDVRPIPKRYRCGALTKEFCALGVVKSEGTEIGSVDETLKRLKTSYTTKTEKNFWWKGLTKNHLLYPFCPLTPDTCC